MARPCFDADNAMSSPPEAVQLFRSVRRQQKTGMTFRPEDMPAREREAMKQNIL
jgi:hypothetical protein